MKQRNRCRSTRSRRTVWTLALVGVLACSVPAAQAQKSTERYIPIGKSPGLSYKHTYIGPIESVDLAERSLTFKTETGPHTVRITDRTRVWLDRSQLQLTNLNGEPSDCRPGRTVEIKFEDPETRRVAEWIKIRITEPGAE